MASKFVGTGCFKKRGFIQGFPGEPIKNQALTMKKVLCQGIVYRVLLAAHRTADSVRKAGQDIQNRGARVDGFGGQRTVPTGPRAHAPVQHRRVVAIPLAFLFV